MLRAQRKRGVDLCIDEAITDSRYFTENINTKQKIKELTYRSEQVTYLGTDLKDHRIAERSPGAPGYL